MIECLIDHRELKLIENLQLQSVENLNCSINFNVKSLDIGDIIFKYEDKYLCIIERKTVSDYVSSITDGRLKNQTIRIKSIPNEDKCDIFSIIYLIEGHIPDENIDYMNGINADTLKSSIWGKILRDNFHVIYSNNLNNTCYILKNIFEKLFKLIPDLNKNKTGGLENEYMKTLKINKKQNLTPKICYITQLSQIPGLSIDIAGKIYEKYNTFPDLIEAYNKCLTIKEKQKLLMSIDKIGKILSERVYNFIYENEK